MKKTDTKSIQGTAILCIIFYYLFHTVSKISKIGASGLFISNSKIALLSTLCHAGVSLFAFVTGYGLAKIAEENRGLEYYKHYFIKKYYGIVRKLTVVIILTAVVCGILMQQDRFVSLWGDGLVAKTLGVLLNATGLAGISGTKWLIGTWWYVGIYLVLLLIAPIVYWLIEKITPYVTLAVCILAMGMIAPLVNSKSIIWYLPIYVLGMCCFQYHWLERVEKIIEDSIPKKVITGICLLGMCFVLAYVRKYFDNKALFEFIFSIVVILLVVLFVLKLQWLKSVLQFIGRQSTFMWLLFAQIYAWWLKKYIIKLQNVWLIYFVVVALALLTAVIINTLLKIYKKMEQGEGYLFLSKDWLLALGVVFINSCAIFYNAIPSYLTNDDSTIQRVLSGSYLGEAIPYQQYVNRLITFPISKLYTIFPNIPWWFLWIELLNYIGMFAITYAIIHYTRKNGKSIGLGICMAELFQGLLILYNVWRPSFTIAPAIFGCALMVLAFKITENEQLGKKEYIYIGLLALGVMIACGTRQQTGLVVSIYVGLTLFYRVIKSKAFLKKNILAILVCTFCVLFIPQGLNQINAYDSRNINDAEYLQFNSARVQFTDYPHAEYSDNPQLYEKIGWNEETYFLADSWCFMQDEVTTENLQYISQNINKQEIAPAKELWAKLWENMLSKAIIIGFVVSFIAMGLFLIFNCTFRTFFVYFLNLFGSAILLIYLTVEGRLIYRGVLVVLIPAAFLNILLIASNIRKESKVGLRNQLVIGIASLVLLITIVDSALPTKSKIESLQRLDKIQDAVYDYLEQHQDNIYISEIHITGDVNPFSLQSEENMVYYGGAQYRSAVMKRKLEKLGIETLDGSIFERENVYFLSKKDIDKEATLNELNTLSAFYHSLQKNYGVDAIEKVDTITDGIYVYRFKFAD